MIPNTQKDTAQKFLEKYRSAASVGVPRKLEELASENEKLKNENEELKSILLKGMASGIAASYVQNCSMH